MQKERERIGHENWSAFKREEERNRERGACGGPRRPSLCPRLWRYFSSGNTEVQPVGNAWTIASLVRNSRTLLSSKRFLLTACDPFFSLSLFMTAITSFDVNTSMTTKRTRVTRAHSTISIFWEEGSCTWKWLAN